MNILTYSEARASLKRVMDEVCEAHAPTVITRVSGEHVVMVSLSDYNGMQETMHLLSSPKNASRLMESIAQLRAGKAREREMLSDEPENEE